MYIFIGTQMPENKMKKGIKKERFRYIDKCTIERKLYIFVVSKIPVTFNPATFI